MSNNITYKVENIFISKSQKFGLINRLIFWATGIFIVCINTFSKKRKTFISEQRSFSYITPVKYEGANNYANAITFILERNQLPMIQQALIHGSIASNEVINYSDIDTILFVNTNNLNNIKDLFTYNKIIQLTYKEMLKQDILQHHGWVIINLKHYLYLNNRIIPYPILSEAKSLFIRHKEQIKIAFSHDQYKHTNFSNLIKSINHKIENTESLKSLYIFKIFISELLLLPTVYLQFKLQKDISKKKSFEIIYSHLNTNDIRTLKEIEKIRINWPLLNISSEKLSLNDLLNKQKMIKTSEEHLQWFHKTKVNIQSLLTNLDQTTSQS